MPTEGSRPSQRDSIIFSTDNGKTWVPAFRYCNASSIPRAVARVEAGTQRIESAVATLQRSLR